MKFLLQAKDCVAIHKPSGWMTYADSPNQRAISAQWHAEKRSGKKLYPVHRIDKDTCGILVFATSPEGSRKLTELFRSRAVKKQYWAIVHGRTPESGEIDQPLPRNKEKTLEPAFTAFKTLAHTDIELEGEQREYSLVQCEPKTGRYHQIRLHLRQIAHPIVGDPEHGNSWNNRVFLEKFGVKRTLLSAVALQFPDREREKIIRLKTQPDPDFQKVLKELNLNVQRSPAKTPQ